MIGKERCRGGGFRSSKLAVIWCSPLKGTLSQPLWEQNPARVHDPPYFWLGIFLFLFCSLCLSDGISSGIGDERDQFKPNSSNWLWYDRFYFVPHTPTTLTVAPRSCCLVYLHAAVENCHSHYYSSAEAVYKVSSINCLLLGVRTCGDMQQPHIRCYYIATKGVDYIAIGRLTVWGHLSNRHRIVVCMVWVERETEGESST